APPRPSHEPARNETERPKVEPLEAERASEPAIVEHGRSRVSEERSPEPVMAQQAWPEHIPVSPPPPAESALSTIESARDRPATDAPAPVHHAPSPVQSFALPPDMVQIETSPDKIREGPILPASSEIAPARPRRPRPSGETAPSEPLVQVETRH